MNDRIKALAQESFFDEATNAPSDRMYTFSEAKMQKFAELIVKECADVVKYYYIRGGEPITPQHIKKHFGVEE
jgi:hypothetical protein